jgi:DNA invertase Pin-like site-specific DNA recombinase
MTKIGYARASTRDQHPEAQAERLKAAGCERIFTDHGASGAKASRPEWDKCLDHLREGDTLICTKLDRIGRSVRNLVEVVADLGKRGVDLQVLDQAIDTRTAGGRLVFHVLAAIAEFERELIVERTKDGLAVTKARGRDGGRKRALTPEQVNYIKHLRGRGWSVGSIQDELARTGTKVAHTTINRALGLTSDSAYVEKEQAS